MAVHLSSRSSQISHPCISMGTSDLEGEHGNGNGDGRILVRGWCGGMVWY
jgi:hypothetical protein